MPSACRRGEERATGELIDPEEIVAEVRAFLGRHGASLCAGERIIAGSLTAPLPLSPGQTIELDLGPLGSVSLATAAE